jgi:glycosyltransferase involved in cell wall biosynthesis
MYKVSVLIPIYNVEDYIERCLVSVFENTIINDCEVVLLNDKTPDNSFELAKEIVSRYPQIKNNVKFLEHKENTGIAQGRNDLLQAASGEYFIFVDSDDYIEKNYLEALYTSAKSNDADVVECDYYTHDFNRNILKCFCGVKSSAFDSIIAKLKGENTAYLTVKLIKTSIIKTHNLKFISGMNLCEDEYFTYCIYCHAKEINYVPQFLYHYVLNKKSITRTLFDDYKIKSVLDCINFSSELLLKFYDNDEIKQWISFRKMDRKRYLLFNTTRSKQKNLRTLWQDQCEILNKMKINPVTKTILRGKSILFFNLYLFIIMMLKRIKNRNFTMKDYLK